MVLTGSIVNFLGILLGGGVGLLIHRLMKKGIPERFSDIIMKGIGLCVLAIATSIDALAVGVSMAFMSVNILFSAVIIGVVAFGMSLVGGVLGKKLGSLFEKWAQVAGGVVLVCIGIKILIEHLT